MVWGCLWIGLCALSCVLMLVIKKNIFILSAIACVVPFALDIFTDTVIWQFVAFALGFVFLLFVSLLFSRTVSEGEFRIDTLIGAKCVVEEEINNNAGRGQVRVQDMMWSARSISDDEIYKVGETLKIVAVEGVKLICKN